LVKNIKVAKKNFSFLFGYSEAEYAFQLKKPTIPLMLEKNYRADGWLGFIVGSKLWIDFTDTTGLNKSLTDLENEIERQGFEPGYKNVG